MTVMRVSFAGEIKKADHKEVGGKKLVEISIVKKNRGKPGEEEHFTWLRISLWEPAAFQLDKLVRGAFIAGSGDLALRIYKNKDDNEKTALECRCTSFDIEVAGGGGSAERAAADSSRETRSPPPRTPPPSITDDEPPF